MIEDYIEAHISPEPERLQQVSRNTYLHRLYPQMCSGHLQGRLLKMLTQMIAPKRILELGTFTGYSTLCFAEGMPDDAELHTVEIDDENADQLEETFAASPWAGKIHLHIGDAIDVVPTLGADWDLVFIDANKRQYCQYYEMALERLRPGGYILADNTLWYGKVTEPTVNDPQTCEIRRFNEIVAADPRVEKVIIPLRDGMTIIHKIK